ncbi:hypothetical protein SAMN00808754_2038 [Thermanaeromonas toyohensis ToBE]|uniref:Uncharacterized protein n=1 Tax=Thermanaeromonas toyohensis ToBE TaxID=698762 RepID=A0A1W1VX44_9FIRM|nr:hypothetical protein [Thermanaeromonas toyohensis]SMB97937.1 hypothetical protein SAMN00808754_2038 [Thermanaeromonas toyohensis ToBE]
MATWWGIWLILFAMCFGAYIFAEGRGWLKIRTKRVTEEERRKTYYGLLALGLIGLMLIVAGQSQKSQAAKSGNIASPQQASESAISNGSQETRVNSGSLEQQRQSLENVRGSVTADKESTEALKQYLYENFGGNGNPKYKTSWYDLISDVQVYSDGKQRWAVVKTPIYHDEEGKRLAVFIARVILSNDKVKLYRAEVDDKNGLPLAMELNPD